MNGLEPFSAVLLMLTCLWGPFMAIQSARRLGEGPLPMTRRRFFLQTIIIQALLFGVAVTASWRTGVRLVVAPPAALVHPERGWGLGGSEGSDRGTTPRCFKHCATNEPLCRATL